MIRALGDPSMSVSRIESNSRELLIDVKLVPPPNALFTVSEKPVSSYVDNGVVSVEMRWMSSGSE